MEAENLEWLVFNALYGDVSGEIPDHLRRMIKAKAELSTLTAERDALRVELEALLEACRPVVEDWLNTRPEHVDSEGYEIIVSAEQLDALVVLVGGK